jgi:hypothetical protein
MLSGMRVTKKVQLKRDSCHHSYKANGHTYQNGLSMRMTQITILHKYSITFLSTVRAETFEPNLLAANDKAFVRAFCHRQQYLSQAGRIAAARTGKMRMALALGAVVGQFEMPGPLINKDLMHQPNTQQAFEGSVDCDLVEVIFSCSPGNLVLAERLARFHKHRKYGRSAGGAVKPGGLQHFACFYFQI